MTVRLLSLLLLSASLNATAQAQSNLGPALGTGETWSAACSSKINHPLYPDAALNTGLAGSVSATFIVDASGKATALGLSGPYGLVESVRTAIDETIFPLSCSGKKLKVEFSFKLEAQLPAQHHVSVCFSHPPSSFSVIANRIEMVCSFHTYASPLVAMGGLHPITVCELLADPMAYDGKEVALLGKWKDSHFDGLWLSEDRCKSRLTTDGYEWPNEVWIAGDRSAPAPPQGLLVLDPHALSEKLELVRGTTSLGLEEMAFVSKEGGGARKVPQHWAVIFGRIEARKQLRAPNEPKADWGNGFGQMNSAPLQIIAKQENTFYISDAASAK